MYIFKNVYVQWYIQIPIFNAIMWQKKYSSLVIPDMIFQYLIFLWFHCYVYNVIIDVCIHGVRRLSPDSDVTTSENITN